MMHQERKNFKNEKAICNIPYNKVQHLHGLYVYVHSSNKTFWKRVEDRRSKTSDLITVQWIDTRNNLQVAAATIA